jgi:hypothetical protein
MKSIRCGIVKFQYPVENRFEAHVYPNNLQPTGASCLLRAASFSAMAMAMTMTMAMASTTGTMALQHAALANSLFCPSPSLAPLRLAAAPSGNVSSAVLSAEPLSLGTGREARGACFKRSAKFQQFSQDAVDGSAVAEEGEEEMEEDDADQYVHIEFSLL